MSLKHGMDNKETIALKEAIKNLRVLSDYQVQGYSWYEALFGNYKWIRRLSKGFWVRWQGTRMWTKYDKGWLVRNGRLESFKTRHEVEDYTENKNG